jgi:hypothetical protein
MNRFIQSKNLHKVSNVERNSCGMSQTFGFTDIANKVQVSLVIRGRYVPLFWTAKTLFDWKSGILNQLFKM